MENIQDDDRLLRRVWANDPSYIKPDNTITSFAFKLRKGKETGLSVDVERLTTYADAIVDPERSRLCSVYAKQVRDIGLDCEHKPVEGNYAHAEIVGEPFSNRQSSELAKAAVYIKYPE